jgi:uncharacterized membrane protein (UPF0127 family)
MHLEVTRRQKHPNRPAVFGALWLIGLVAAGCSQSAPPPDTDTQPSPAVTRVELPHAVLPDGFVIDLELAETQQEVTDGLMYRPSLPVQRGMLFIFGNDRYPAFWMKNTLISLDLVFLDSAGAVVDIAAGVPPCASDPCPTYSPKNPARAVLEIGAGVAAAHGVETGAVITFERVHGYPVEASEGAAGPPAS